MLSTYDWIYGIAQLAAGFLAIIAAIIAASMFRKSGNKFLKAWKLLIPALLLFTLEEVVGSLKTFGVYITPHLTHIIPAFILLFLIAALITQMNIMRGWFE